MKRILLALAFLAGGIAGASAACTSPAVMHDFPGTSFNMSLATNAGDGNCSSNMTLVGTLPAYTSTPTFNLGTLNGAATAAGVAAVNTTLGTPMQNSGGSVTANLGTIAGVSTAANQATEIASLATIATNSALALPAQSNHTTNIGAVDSINQYPATAVPYTASATGTTGATTATLAGAASVTTYLCSLSIRSNATAAATGNATVTGTITGTLNYTHWTAPLASGIGITEMIFTPCVPASAANTSIAVISPAPGTGGIVSVTATGYKL